MLLEIWLLTLLGSTTDSILGCWSISGGHWGVWLHHYASRESNSSSGKNKKGKEKKKSNKTRFCSLQLFCVSGRAGVSKGKKGTFFSAWSWVWMSPFRFFAGCVNLTAWVTMWKDQLGNGHLPNWWNVTYSQNSCCTKQRGLSLFSPEFYHSLKVLKQNANLLRPGKYSPIPRLSSISTWKPQILSQGILDVL